VSISNPWGRYTAIGAALLGLGVRASAQQPPVERFDPRVEALLRRLTLEEKVGLMTQVDISVVTRVRGSATRRQELDSAKLEEIVVRRNVGSLLNVAGVALTAEHWAELTSTIQRFAARRRVPLPVLYGIDAVHGHQYMRGATIFPHNIGMAATWNPALVRHANVVTTYETRASGITWNFSPVLDLGRQPLWSRFYETFGEDPYLASVMGVAAIDGSQQDPRPAIAALLAGESAAMLGPPPPLPERQGDFGPVFVAATGKHFLGYSLPRTGKDRTTAWIPERQLREYFLPPFRAAVNAGVRAIMVNSGDVNGVPVHASRELVTDLLRNELGFRGVVVSDWEDIVRLHTIHRVARTRLAAVRMAIDAGIDVSMVPYSTSFADDVLALVHAGEITEARIDQSVRRILQLEADLGLFDDAAPWPGALMNVNAPPLASISRRAADESITLLENRGGILPLKKGMRVFVTGPGATSVPAMHGGWTYTWQGADSAMYPGTARSLLDALRSTFGADRVTHVRGATFTDLVDVGAAVAAARSADVAIVALAEAPQAEKPGDIDDLTLSPAQLRLAKAIEGAGIPVVLVLFEGRPRIVRDVVDSARAVVLAYLPGPFGGEAVARVLAGEVNPAGRLPFSYPRFTGAIEHYDRSVSADATADSSTGGYRPEWEFGHGLSYTTFAYDSLRVTRDRVGMRDTVVVSVTVANTGAREGMEVVQLYTRQLYASVTPPVRRLRAFEKIVLTPGAKRLVTFRVPARDLAFVGRDNRLGIEPGEFEIHVGGRMVRFTVE
jgi:beta-glucosidase